MSKKKHTPSQAGFTMVELAITLAIAGVMAAMALPGMQYLIESNRATTSVNAFIGALNYARSEAIKRGIRVAVCRSEDGTSCSAGSDWEAGWLVFVNVDGVEPPAVNTVDGDLILRMHPELANNITLESDTTYEDYVLFRSNGSLPSSGLFKACIGTDDTRAQGVVLSRTGRIRTAQDTDSPADGIPNDDAGDNISCS